MQNITSILLFYKSSLTVCWSEGVVYNWYKKLLAAVQNENGESKRPKCKGLIIQIRLKIISCF